MINLSILSLDNRVLVKSSVLGYEGDFKECVVVGVDKDTIKVRYPKTDVDYVCKKDQVEAIPLTDTFILSLGFSKRNMKDVNGDVINDLTLCKTINSSLWFILSLKKRDGVEYFLEIKECNDTIGSGFVKSMHQLQNLVKFITDERCKI